MNTLFKRTSLVVLVAVAAMSTGCTTRVGRAWSVLWGKDVASNGAPKFAPIPNSPWHVDPGVAPRMAVPYGNAPYQQGDVENCAASDSSSSDVGIDRAGLGDEAASRLSSPAGYRVLYFPDDDGSDFSAERHREVVKVSDESMRRDPFAPTVSGGATIASADRRGVPTAKAYAAPDASAADAASRMWEPRSDYSNVSDQVGAYRTSEYRVATVRTASGLVKGWARPLGFAGPDERSKKDAKLALNRAANEELVYFQDCGWAGFVRESN